MAQAFGLGIDFGTSNTVALMRWPDGRVRPLLYGPSPLLPSAVFAPQSGEDLVVGADALHHARFEPAGLEPNPKQHIDDPSLLLGAREVPVVELVAAVLKHVITEARRVAGDGELTVALSHPAGWGAARRQVLLEAARAAGIAAPRLVPEPVAAITYFTTVLEHQVPPGKALVVYDLGAGTFDASVVVRRAAGFEVVAVDGLNDVGGLDIDATIVQWLSDRYAPAAPELWARLADAKDAESLRHRRMLWDDSRVAKEMLSRAPAVVLQMPAPLDVDAQLTREEFEAAAKPLIERTVRTTTALIDQAGVARDDVHGILLVGGGSRIPLVATMLHRALGVAPTITEQPEIVVAEGCLFTLGTAPSAAPDPSAADPAAPGPAAVLAGTAADGPLVAEPGAAPLWPAIPIPPASAMPAAAAVQAGEPAKGTLYQTGQFPVVPSPEPGAAAASAPPLWGSAAGGGAQPVSSPPVGSPNLTGPPAGPYADPYGAPQTPPGGMPGSPAVPYAAPQSGVPYAAPQSGAPYVAPQSGVPYAAPQSGVPYAAPQSGAPYAAPGPAVDPYGVPQTPPGGMPGSPYGAPQSGAPYGGPQTPPGGVAAQGMYAQPVSAPPAAPVSGLPVSTPPAPQRPRFVPPPPMAPMSPAAQGASRVTPVWEHGQAPRSAAPGPAPIDAPRKPRRSLNAVLVGVVVLALLAAAATIYLLNTGNSVGVPTLVGLSQDEADRALADRGLVGSPVVGGKCADAKVIEQGSAKGTKVDKGAVVTYTVCGVKVPDVIGQSQTEAAANLRDAGFDVDLQAVDSPEPAGTVITVVPDPGTIVGEQSNVTIKVARGVAAPETNDAVTSAPTTSAPTTGATTYTETIEVPDVVGQNLEYAKEQLRHKGFTGSIKTADQYTDDPDHVGKVLSQDPKSGRKAAKNATFTLKVGKLKPSSTPPSGGTTPVPTLTCPTPKVPVNGKCT